MHEGSTTHLESLEFFFFGNLELILCHFYIGPSICFS